MPDTDEDAEETPFFQRPIEPGSPTAEHVAFVILGVVLSLAVLLRVAGVV